MMVQRYCTQKGRTSIRFRVNAVQVMSTHVSSLTKHQWREHKKTSDPSIKLQHVNSGFRQVISISRRNQKYIEQAPIDHSTWTL